MPKNEDIQHSILIVSAAEKFDALIKRILHPGAFMSVEFRKSAAAARRSILERYYDMVVVNAPLPDESGIGFSIDVTSQCNASVLIVVPSDTYEDVLEQVTDYGILAIAKPFPKVRLGHAVRFLSAEQARIHRLEKKLVTAEEKTEEIRLVSKAKILLIEEKGMTEEEAHRLIGKEAMNQGVSRRKIAERILEDYE